MPPIEPTMNDDPVLAEARHAFDRAIDPGEHPRDRIRRMALDISGGDQDFADFAVQIGRAESNFRDDAVSPKGARGAMQVMPGTFHAEGGRNIEDSAERTAVGVNYLWKQLQAFGGDKALAAAAYNAGPGAVARYGGIPPFAETRNYVAKVAGVDPDSVKAATGIDPRAFARPSGRQVAMVFDRSLDELDALPDGPAEVAAAVADSPSTAVKPPRGALGAVADYGLEAAGAVVGGAKAISDFFDPSSRASQGLDAAGKWTAAHQSDEVKQAKGDYQRELDAAQGVGDEIAATLRYAGRNPGLTAAQVVGNIAPVLLGVGGVGAGARALGSGARAAQMLARGTGVGLGVTMGGGDAAGTAFEKVMRSPDEVILANPAAQRLLQTGMPVPVIKEALAKAAASDAKLVPALLGGVFGATGVERWIAGGRSPGRLIGALIEGAQEAVEEGVTQREANRAAAAVNPAIDVNKGVAAAATMGSIMGAGAGATLGGHTTRAIQPQPVPSVRAAAPLEEPGPLARASASGAIVMPASPPTTVLEPVDAVSLGESRAEATADPAPGVEQAAIDRLASLRRAIDAGEVPQAGGSGRAADRFVDLAPMSRSQAEQRLTVLRDQAEQFEIDPFDLEVVPHPGQPAAFAIGRTQPHRYEPELQGRQEPAAPQLRVDPVDVYVDQQRQTNTPAAQFFVKQFDTGRITREDVLAAIHAQRPTDEVQSRLQMAIGQREARQPPVIQVEPAARVRRVREAVASGEGVTAGEAQQDALTVDLGTRDDSAASEPPAGPRPIDDTAFRRQAGPGHGIPEDRPIWDTEDAVRQHLSVQRRAAGGSISAKPIRLSEGKYSFALRGEPAYRDALAGATFGAGQRSAPGLIVLFRTSDSGSLMDEEALQRRNLTKSRSDADANLIGREAANLLADGRRREAEASFDAGGRFIGKKYRVVPPRGGVYLFDDIEQAKQFLGTHGRRQGSPRALIEQPASPAVASKVQPAGPERAKEAPAPAAAEPAKAKKPKPAPLKERLAQHFTPGNIVKSYGGHDRVISFDWKEGGDWSVRVQAVTKKDGQWVVQTEGGREAPIRTHATRPDEREFRSGVVERAPSSTVEKPEVQAQRESAASAESRSPDDKPQSEQPLFSLQSEFAADALTELAANDESFLYPISKSSDLATVMREVDPAVEYVGDETRPDEKDESGAEQRLMFKSVTGENFYVHTDPKRVWVDLSRLDEGTGGSAVYAAVANWAYNTKRVFIGDPAGLSRIALRRRTEHMLSSALKFGTTAHLEPHPDQLTGDPKHGVPALKWTRGDDYANVQSLIETSVANTFDADPEYADARYDFSDRRFVDADGSPIEEADFEVSAAQSPGGRAAAIGRRTYARAVLLNTLLRGSGATRPGLLAGVLRESGQRLGALRGVFYSKTDAAQNPAEVAAAAKRVQTTVDRISARWQNAPAVTVLATQADVPQQHRPADGKTAEGFFADGQVYLVADALPTDADVARVLLHESLGHFGLRGVYGDRLDGVLDQIASVRRREVEAKRQQYGLADSREGRRIAAEEVLAGMAQANPQIGFVRRAVAAIRGFLRRVGVDLKVTDDEIVRSYLLPARRFVTDRQPRDARGRFVAEDRSEAGLRPFADEDVRFSIAQGRRMVPELRSGRIIKALIRRASNAVAEARPTALYTMGRRQIVEVYGRLLPDLRTYSDEMERYDADKNAVAADTEEVLRRWSRVKDGNDLADLMHDATRAGFDADPTADQVGAAGQPEALTAEQRTLRDRFDSLSQEAQAIYRQARDMYARHWAAVQHEIEGRIERAGFEGHQKRQMIEESRQAFSRSLEGVYFPLSRFGQYFVNSVDADGNVVASARAESLTEAQDLRERLQAEYPDAEVSKVLKAREYDAARDSASRGFVQRIYEAADQLSDREEAAQLKDTINQLFLSTLPDASWAKHGLHRKGTPGYSRDARRAFAQSMFHGAYYLAKLKHADVLADRLRDMQDFVDSKKRDTGFDSVKAQQVVDEMMKRHTETMNPRNTPLANALTSVGFVWHMGLSPASALVNLSQTPLVAAPLIAARFGFAKTGAALIKASQETALAKNDLRGKLGNDEEEAALKRAIIEGVVDVTQSHDVAAVAQGRDAQLQGGLSTVMRAASWLFHQAERFNRQSTFVAAFRLAREAGEDAGKAYETAREFVYDGHFNYSASNRSRLLMGPTARVLFLFKQFGQNMVFTLARNAQQAIAGETAERRSEARKALAGLLVMHGLFAGAFGLPMASVLLGVASMIGGDDDEPFDAAASLRNYLADATSKEIGEVIAHGLLRGVLPGDVAGRVGLDSLFMRDIDTTASTEKAWEQTLYAVLGPVAGIGLNVARGAGDVAKGDVLRGVAGMLPKAIADPLKALRFTKEGAVDRSGVELVDELTPGEIASQVLGFTPARLKEAAESRGAILTADRQIDARRSALLRMHTRAVIEGDPDAQAETRERIAGFNRAQPHNPINRQALASNLKDYRKRVEQSRDGIYLPAKKRQLAERGEFARVD